MTTMKIHEHIAALRKQKGLTQEELASVAQISDSVGLPPDGIRACLTGALSPFVLEKEDTEDAFRFDGKCMNILPIISLLAYR